MDSTLTNIPWDRIPTFVLMGVIITALVRGWVVTSAHYTEVCQARDKQTELAISSSRSLEAATASIEALTAMRRQ
jgi:acetolactate synthase regulatory subunit